MGARARVDGMVVYDHHDLASEHRTRVAALLRAKHVTLCEHRFLGIEKAVHAFHTLITGRGIVKSNRPGLVIDGTALLTSTLPLRSTQRHRVSPAASGYGGHEATVVG